MRNDLSKGSKVGKTVCHLKKHVVNKDLNQAVYVSMFFGQLRTTSGSSCLHLLDEKRTVGSLASTHTPDKYQYPYHRLEVSGLRAIMS